MADIAALEVELNLDTGQFTGRMNQAGIAVQQFGRKVDSETGRVNVMQRELSSTAEAVDQLKRAAIGFAGFQAITNSVQSLLQARIAMDQITYGLQGALGSTKAAGEAYAFVSGKAKELGLDLQVTATEFMKLTAAATAMDVPMEKQKELFDGLARSATVLHLSADQVKYATMGLSQMFGKGKIQAEELRRQLGEAIPGVVPRFQKAVMEMTKGTDLQNKSFDQLLQGGHLVTDKFLPALIQALKETGAGAEAASHGLNAGVNLLKSAWFELKAGMSSGLFSDAANASVRLMATNLEKVATAATLAAGVMAARFVGGGMAMGAGRMTSMLAEQRMNQAGAAIWAQSTSAMAANSAAKLENMKITQSAIVTAQASAAAELNAANVKMAAAAKMIASPVGQGVGKTLNTVAAQAALAAAQTARNTALNNFAQLGTQAARIEAQLAAQALVTAEANVAAAAAEKSRMAASTLAGRAASAAKGVGGAAMGLVGGPWGAAALAVGALGLALYNMNKEAEASKVAFKSQSDELVNLKMTIGDVTASYNAMDGNTSLKNLAETWNSAGVAIRAADKDLVALKAKLTTLQQGTYTAGVRVLDEKAIKEAQLQVNNLSGNVAQAKLKFFDLEGALKAALDPATFEAMRNAALKANDVEFNKILAGLSDVEKAAYQAAGAMAKINAAVGDEIFAKQVENMKKKSGEFAAWQLVQGKKIRDAGGADAMTPAARATFNQQAAFMKGQIALGLQLDASKKKSTASTKAAAAAVKEQANDFSTLNDRMDRQIENDRDAAMSTDRLTQAERLSNAITVALASSRTNLTAQGRKDLIVKQAQMELQGKINEEVEREERALKSMKALKAELAADLVKQNLANNQDLAKFGKGAAEIEQMARLDALAVSHANKLADLEAKGYAAGSQQRKNELAEINANYAAQLSAEQKFQADKKLAQSDWLGGVKTAWADYKDTANDTNTQVQQVAAKSFSGVTDAITQMVTTGKADFKALAVSILADIAKILVQKVIVGIVGAMTGSANGNVMTSNGPMDLTGSANGNIMTPSGPLPLRAYANGGIAKKPQLSLFGEGKMPEAYVPLPDGRTIPVTMKGGASMGGGAAGNANVSVTVNIDNRGNETEGENKSDGREEGKALGDLIKTQVLATMSQESRQGGMLWKMNH